MRYSKKLWEAAREEARLILIERAKKKYTISYKELTELISSISFKPDDPIYHELLEEISLKEHFKGKGLLTALVVNSKTKIPGNGFFELARECDRKYYDKRFYWQKERDRVFDDYSRLSDNKDKNIPSNMIKRILSRLIPFRKKR